MGLGLLPDMQEQQLPVKKGLGLLPDSEPDQIRQNAHLTRSVQPDQAAQDQVLSNNTGFNSDFVSRNREEVKSEYEANNIVDQVAQFSGIKSFLSDPDNMAVSRDDIDNLVETESLFKQYVENPGKALLKLAPRAAYGMAESANEVTALLAGSLDSAAKSIEDITGLKRGGLFKWLQDWALNAARAQTDILQNNKYIGVSDRLKGLRLWDNPYLLLDPEWLIQNTGDAFASTVPAIVAATASGGSVALGGFIGGLQEGASLFNQMMEEKKVDQATAATAALTYGMVSAWLNTIGLDAILDKTPVKNWKQRIAKSIVKGGTEALTEWAEEPSQALIKAIAEGDTPNEVVDEVRQALTNVDVIPGAFLMGGGASYFSAQFKNELRQAAQAEQDVLFFEALNNSAADSKVRERLSDAYKKAVDSIIEENGGPVKNVYVDAELFQQVFSEQPEELNSLLEKTGLVDQFQESLATGEDLEIPISDYMTHIAGTDISSSLINDLKFSPNAMSARQTGEFKRRWADDMQAQIKEIQAEKKAKDKFETERQQVYKDVLEQRLKTGLVEQTAKADAAQFTAFVSTYAKRSGESPVQVAKQILSGIQGGVFEGSAEQQQLRQLGTGKGSFYVKFPNQIKSATGNQGTFDPKEQKTGWLDQDDASITSIAGNLKRDLDNLPKSIKEQIEEIKIFGSYLKNKDDANDIDVHIRTLINDDFTPQDYSYLGDVIEGYINKEGFEASTGKKIDVVIEPSEIGMGIEKGKGHLIYRAKESKRGSFDTPSNRNNASTDIKFQTAAIAGADLNDPAGIADAQKEWAEKGVESKYFKKWFGDSKVVDENGKPLVVYHGTTNNFTTFKKTGVHDVGWLGSKLFYFSQNPGVAESYSYITLPGRKEVWSEEGYLLPEGAAIYPAYLSAKNIYMWPKDRKVATTQEEADAISNELKAKGYDAVALSYTPLDGGKKVIFQEVAVFSPNQIKSATGNQGTFDLNNPNILLQQSAATAGAGLNDPASIADAQKEWAEKGVESKYFKKWFGDSKVVDENGKPLVVYHGTPEAGHVIFDPDKAGKFTGGNVLEGTIWASENPSVASIYAGNSESLESSAVYPLYLKIENPLLVDAEKEAKEKGYADQYFILQNGEKVYDISFFKRDLISKAKEGGYDGVIFFNGYDGIPAEGNVYTLFSPNQIKSATGNQGTFDLNNPNILLQSTSPDTDAKILYQTDPDYKPEKTIKAYKIFRTLKSQPGKIFPLFIGKTKPTPVGGWIRAEFIPTKGFAQRPGWHAGVLPIAPHLRSKENQIAPGRVWAEIEMPADKDWQSIADKSRTRDIRDQIPENGYYKFKTNKMQGGAWLIGGAIKINKLLNDDEVVKILTDAGYSLEEAYRETHGRTLFQNNDKPLYVVHNLSVENVLHADKMGGLAVPSLAITSPETGSFENFGEISLIADPSLIDPRKSALNKVFNADAYSPRYPTVIFKLNQKHLSRAWDKLSDSSKVMGHRLSSELDNSEIENKGLDAFYNSSVVQYDYLKSIGKAPKIRYKKKPQIPGYLKKFKGSFHSFVDTPEFKKAAKKYYEEKVLSKPSEIQNKFRENFFDDEGEVFLSVREKLADKVSRVTGPKEIDFYAMQDAVRKRLKSKKAKAAFQNWVDEKFSDVIKSERIPNGFMYSGKRKYLPHDLDTVVKLMKKGLKDGEGFNYGVGSIRAVTSKQFKSLSDIKKDRDKIVSAEIMEAVKKEADDEFFKLTEDLKDYYRYDSSAFGYFDDTSNAFKEFARRGVFGFNEYFEDVPKDLLNEVRDFLQKLSNLPTEYFEAKIQRAVGLDEFQYAIVPKNTDPKVKKLLRDKGLTIKLYDQKVKGDRARVIGGLNKILFQNQNGPNQLGFYSQMRNVLEQKLNKAPAKQMKQQIESWAKKGAFKQEELEWSGLLDWLDQQKGKITKQEVLSYLDQNELILKEVVKGDSARVIEEISDAKDILARGGEIYGIDSAGRAVSITNDTNEILPYVVNHWGDYTVKQGSFEDFQTGEIGTKFSDYQLSGGENYREILLTLPEKSTTQPFRQELKELQARPFFDLSEAEKTRLKELEKKALGRYLEEDIKLNYRSPHWEEPNVLAHARVSDRKVDGKKILHIEEIQSDWHQEGRKKGYTGKKEVEAYTVYVNGIKAISYETKQEAEDHAKRALKYNAPEDVKIKKEKVEVNFEGVPNAPWKKTWPLKTFQRLVRYAVEKGYDGVAWTQGQEQADRYDLRKQVDAVEWQRENQLDGSPGKYTISLKAEGAGIDGYSRSGLSIGDVENFVGKSIAEKILEAEKKYNDFGEFEGEDLKVGGEGMKAFYDRMLPNEVNKFFNKKIWGRAKVGEITIEGRGSLHGPAPRRIYSGPDLEIKDMKKFLDQKYSSAINSSARGVISALKSGSSFKSAMEREGNELLADKIGGKLSIDKSLTLHYLPITPEMKKLAMEMGFPLFQKRNAPRGAFIQETNIIKLFESANASTFLHESGHAYFTFMERVAQMPNTPKELKDDWNTILKYVGNDGSTPLTTEQHEKLARSLEAYFMKGKAPSAKLVKVFQQFANWLKQIYKHIMSLNVTLNDEIRGVFDRMFATDQEIEEAQAYYDAQKPFFDDLSETEKKKYDKLRTDAELSAADKRLRKYTRAYIKALGGMKAFKEKAQKQVNETPVYAAMDQAVKNGGLNMDDVDLLIGEEIRKKLSKKRPGLVKKDGRIFPDLLAAQHGYSGAVQMITDFLKAETKTKAVKRLADQFFEAAKKTAIEGYEKYPQETGAQGPAADEDYHSDARMAVIAAEIQILQNKQKLGKGYKKAVFTRLQVQAIRDIARQVLDSKPLKDALAYHKYSSAEIKAAKQARQALKNNDLEAAEKFKRRELLNHALVLEAVKIREEHATIIKKLKRALKRNIDDRYKDQVINLLNKFGFIKRAPAEDVKDFAAFMESLNTSEAEIPMGGAVPQWSSWVFTQEKASSPGAGYKSKFTTVEFRELGDIINWLVETGYDLKKGRLIAYKQNLDDLCDELIAPALSLKSRKIYKKGSFLRKLSDNARAYIADHDMLPFIADMMDGFQNFGPDGAFGPNRRHIVMGLAERQNRRDVMMEEAKNALEPSIDIFIKSMKKHPKVIKTNVPVPTILAEDGDFWTFEKILSIALNMGTETNMQRLQDGYGLTPDQLYELTSILTKEDWGAVQAVLDFVNSYWEQLDRTHYKVNHFHLSKVKARPIQVRTAEGENIQFNGGYYPLKYNPHLAKQVAEWNEKDDLMNESVWGHPGVTAGMTKARTDQKVTLPVNLSLSVLYTHIEDTIHYITHADIIKDLDRVTQSKKYQKVMTEKLGAQVYKLIRPTLRHVARPERAIGVSLDKGFDRMRALSTSYILGLNASVAVKQVFSLPGVIHDIGLGAYVKGFAHVLKNPIEAYKIMHELSPYMKTRSKSFDRDLKESLGKLKAGTLGIKPGSIDQLRQWAFGLITFADFMTVHPSWWGAYKLGMKKEGGNPEAAARFADEMIRQSQPSSKPMDLSAIQRNRNGLVRAFTMFMTFTAKYGNRQRYFFRGWKEGKIGTVDYTRHLLLEAVAPPMLMNLMFAAMWGDEPDPEDAMIDVMLYQFAGYVLARDAAALGAWAVKTYALEKDTFKPDISQSPAFTGIKITQRSAEALVNWLNDMGDDDQYIKAVWAFAEMTSFWSGVPASKLAKNLIEGIRQYDEENGTPFNIIIPDPKKRNR